MVNLMQKDNYILNDKPLSVGTKIQLDDNKMKIYIIKSCRKGIEFLGEPKGYIIKIEKLEE